MTSSMISKSFAGVTNKLINQRDLKQILEADIRSFSKRHHAEDTVHSYWGCLLLCFLAINHKLGSYE